jgi:hypothetical protein
MAEGEKMVLIVFFLVVAVFAIAGTFISIEEARRRNDLSTMKPTQTSRAGSRQADSGSNRL